MAGVARAGVAQGADVSVVAGVFTATRSTVPNIIAVGNVAILTIGTAGIINAAHT